jgi:hypothetical protein
MGMCENLNSGKIVQKHSSRRVTSSMILTRPILVKESVVVSEAGYDLIKGSYV